MTVTSPSEATAPNDDAPGGETACWTDEDLFREPQRDECPICFLPLPVNHIRHQFQSCCGKVICHGCIHADRIENNREICAFCRAPEATSNGERMERLNKRVEVGDAQVMFELGVKYSKGSKGLQQNYNKAMELLLQAGELGHAASHCNIGFHYYNGQGVEKDEKKAKYYYELAAMHGNAHARHNLGAMEFKAANMNRAVKHWIISAAAGHDDALKQIRDCFLRGHATKDDFEKALRAHKEAKDEMKSDQRAAAAKIEYRLSSLGQG